MAGVHATLIVGPTAMLATGGTITEYTKDGRRWRLHTFLESGTFTVINRGTMGGIVRRRVIAGGGGGGSSIGNQGGAPDGAGACGGGGAGGDREDSIAVTEQAYPVVIGLGGATQANGQNSSFAGLVSLGGGYGGWYANVPGADGGSGGGSGQGGTGATVLGGNGTPGHGNRGGRTVIPAGKSTGGGGGGGGSEAVGADCIPHYFGAAGGLGRASDISGTSVRRAAGGGGAGSNASSGSGTPAGSPGPGGQGGGGSGAGYKAAFAQPGQSNSGSGGGGGNGPLRPGAPGGSGRTEIAYPITA